MAIDASVAVKWFVDEPGHDAAMGIVRSGKVLVAPDLAVIEIMNVLQRKHRQHVLSERQLSAAARTIVGCFGRLVAAASVVELAVSLSRHIDRSVYDCACLACAVLDGAVSWRSMTRLRVRLSRPATDSQSLSSITFDDDALAPI